MHSIWTPCAVFFSFFSHPCGVLVSGTAGAKQVSAKPKPELHCTMWRWIIKQHSVTKGHLFIMLQLMGLSVCLNSDYLERPSETREHLGLSCVLPCVHTFPLCVSKTPSWVFISLCLLANKKKKNSSPHFCFPTSVSFCSEQLWKRSGGRHAHRHSGGTNPEGDFTSNWFKVVLRKPKNTHLLCNDTLT